MARPLGSLLDAAIARRAAWGLPETRAGRQTDCFRLVDGRGDGLEGLEIDSLGGHWVVGTRDVRWPEGLEDLALGRGAKSVWWKRLAEEKRGLEWRAGEAGEGSSSRIPGWENGLEFVLDLAAGYSQGLFLDQRLNRARVRQAVAAQAKATAAFEGNQIADAPRILNTFAYTGGFSLAAAAGGAVTTTLDLSQAYLDWAKENFRANSLDPDAHFWVKGDATEWLQRWAKAGRQFDGIVLDPPTFSRRGKQTWSVERDLPALIRAAAAVLAPGGWVLVSTNCRKMTDSGFAQALNTRAAALAWEALPMPPEFTGEPFLLAAWGQKS